MFGFKTQLTVKMVHQKENNQILGMFPKLSTKPSFKTVAVT